MGNYNIKFSDLIKQYRKENRLTQAEFAKKIGKSQVQVYNYERDYHYPKANDVRTISRIIGEPDSLVLKAIEYSKNSVIKEYDDLILDLGKLSEEDIRSKYKVMIDGVELTDQEFEKIKETLEFILFKRSRERNE